MKKLLIVWAACAPLGAFGADCYVTEYNSVLTDPQGRTVPVPGVQLATEQRVTFTTSTQSAAFGPRTRYIGVVCTAAAHYAFGPNPTATADNSYFPANATEYREVVPGQEIAFYDGSS